MADDPPVARELLAAVLDTEGGVIELKKLALRLGFRGRLSSPSAGDTPADELIERARDTLSPRKQGKARMSSAPFVLWDLPAGWAWTTFGEIADARLGKMLDKAKNSGKPRKYLRNANLQWFRFELDSLYELRLEDDELEEYSLNSGDLVVCEGGEPGRAAVVDASAEGMTFQKALHRVRPVPGVDSHYLALLLRHYTWEDRLSGLFTGATIKHLTGKSLYECPVPLAPDAEQLAVVAAVERLFSKCDALGEALVQRKLIGQSLFRGLSAVSI